MELTTAQLYAMQSLVARGWPMELVAHLLPRCSATQGEWQALLNAQLVEARNGRYQLTTDGFRLYREARRRRNF